MLLFMQFADLGCKVEHKKVSGAEKKEKYLVGQYLSFESSSRVSPR
jgi:hypothetical protein